MDYWGIGVMVLNTIVITSLLHYSITPSLVYYSQAFLN